MKNILLYIIGFIFTSSLVFSQNNFWLQTSLDSVGIIGFAQTGNVIYAGSNEMLYKSVDNGDNWELIFSNWEKLHIDNLIAISDSIILLGTSYYGSEPSDKEGLMMSDNQGLTWSRIAFADTSIICLYKTNDNIIYASSGGGIGNIYRSVDSGFNWELLYESNNTYIRSLVSDNNGNIIAGTSQNEIIISVDNGNTWNRFTPNWGIEYGVSNLFIFGDTVLAGSYEGLFRSEDFGQNWVRIDEENLIHIYDMVMVYDNNLYLSEGNYQLGYSMYFSNDKGENWSKINDGFPNTNDLGYLYVYDLIEHNNHLFIGTDYGVHKSETLITSVESENIPESYSLKQNYPNPFNPTTTIEFHLPKASNIELNIFDVLGRNVATLINKGMTAGKHSLSFNAYKLSSGVYFYRLKTEEFTTIKKMLLLR